MPASPQHSTPSPAADLLPAALAASIAAAAKASRRFAEVSIDAADGAVRCLAAGPESPAHYLVHQSGGRFFVSLTMADRYLSQSIEQDLVHTGDKMTDLLHDELVDLGSAVAAPAVEHFRSPPPAKLFTFRSAVGITSADANASKCAGELLMAYETVFGHLGGMAGDDD